MQRRLQKVSDPNEPSLLLRGRVPPASLIQTLAVAEYRNFRHAANPLGVSLSSVSAHVKALEVRHGEGGVWHRWLVVEEWEGTSC